MSSFYALPAPGGSGEALAQAWLAASAGKHALAIGPGLPATPGDDTVRGALLALLAGGSSPLVLDADALNQLVGEDAALRQAARSRPIVLTPHPGEAARLLDQSVPEVQADRIQSARTLSQRTGAVVLLKGARTLVVGPDGPDVSEAAPAGGPAGSRSPLSVVPTGNAGMGSGGMGDVLTGVIGALLAAGWSAYDAACAGAYWHGLAGDRAALRRAPGSILLATELIDALDEARQHGLSAPPAVGWPLREVHAC
jgi:NAD(P)H-hydrate epimerase